MLRSQTGDTLVEVALAMAILGAVIAAAYGISNRAVRLGQEAKHRNEAAQLQQYQAEAIRNYRDNYGWTNFTAKFSPFAISNPALLSDENPCDDSGVSSVNRFNMGVSAAKKWTVTAGNFEDGLFTQCMTVQIISANKYRLNSYINWGQNNQSVLTTYLGDISGITPPATP